jgi:hypothetical protein
MDYSVCQAMAHTGGVTGVLLIYDIACQWFKNFAKRVGQTPTLHVKKDLNITAAVGKFHLGAHIDSCFALHSLNFVKGAGQIDGEIIETLWAIMNNIAGSTRTMGWAFRQETIDKHMNDSNWLKTVNIGEFLDGYHCQVNNSKTVATLITKLKRAIEGLKVMVPQYEDLTAVFDDTKVRRWSQEAQNAEQVRGASLTIYDVKMEKG